MARRATPATTTGVEFRILGPLEVRDGDALLTPPGAGLRSLLTILLLHANEAVSTDRLLDALWPAGLPPSGAAALQVRVSQLRKALGSGRAADRDQAAGIRDRASAEASSTCIGSRSSSNRRMPPSRRSQPRCCARHSVCGGGLRWRMLLTRTSRSRRSRGSRSCGWPRSNAGSRPTSSSAATRI